MAAGASRAALAGTMTNSTAPVASRPLSAMMTSMAFDADEAAAIMRAAAGIAPGEVPPRRFGADWFREQPAWLSMATVADRLVRDPGFDPSTALEVAAELLAHTDPDDEVAKLIEVGFVEAMICVASHGDGIDGDRIVRQCPLELWRIWHRRRELLEALSEQRYAHTEAPRALDDADEGVAMMARCTTYQAESGRYVVLAELISADRPSPWPLRHPVLVGVAFAAVLATMLLLSMLTAR